MQIGPSFQINDEIVDFINLIKASKDSEQIANNYNTMIKANKENLSYNQDDIMQMIQCNDSNYFTNYNKDRLLYRKSGRENRNVKRKWFGADSTKIIDQEDHFKGLIELRKFMMEKDIEGRMGIEKEPIKRKPLKFREQLI